MYSTEATIKLDKIFHTIERAIWAADVVLATHVLSLIFNIDIIDDQAAICGQRDPASPQY